MSKFMAFTGTLAALNALSFAWSISGIVQTDAGQPLAGVTVSSFNYAGFETTSNETGAFTLSNGSDGLFGVEATRASVTFKNNVINVSNIKAQTLTVSVMDALGKVAYSKTLHNVSGFAIFDLNQSTAVGAKFLRINADGNANTYMLDKNVMLLKDGEPLPFLQFAEDGYKNATYQAKADIETNVIVKMEKASALATSSSSQQPEAKSSSSSAEAPKSSSSEVATIIETDCTGKTYAAGDHKMSVNVDGKSRTFIMHVPSAYKGTDPVPLVVDYHPIGGSGQGELSSSPYKGKTDPEGVITLYPDGTAKPGGMGNGWNVGPCCSNDDDVKFSREMIKAVEEKVCINKQRVYATGFSMGGGMSNHVACFMSDIYAAVAPAAMDLNTTNSAKCSPERPVPIIMFRGTNDFVCKYQGGDSGFNDGLNFLGAEGNFKFWAQKNGCEGSPSKNSNGCDEYSKCKDGSKVILCTKQGGGHDYGDASVGWPFLKQYELPASFVK